MSRLNPESRLQATSLISAWSGCGLRHAPASHAIVSARLFAKIEEQDPGLFNPELLAEHLGIRVITRILAAREGGLEAALVPDYGHTFDLIVDPEPSPNTARLDFRQARIGHELAHTLFYDWHKDPPKHLTGWGGSPSEERFCDGFADDLLEKAVENGTL